MDLADDLIIASVSAAAALLGAWIGARATRRASVDALTQAAEAANRAWRTALHYECQLNINLNKERADDKQPWTFDTSVLSESLSHAAAFTAEELQRIVWARTHAQQMHDAADELRRTDSRAFRQKLADSRSNLLGEINDLEVHLRQPRVSHEQPQLRRSVPLWRLVRQRAGR